MVYDQVPHAGLEPATFRLEGERAIQLRQWGKDIKMSMLSTITIILFLYLLLVDIAN